MRIKRNSSELEPPFQDLKIKRSFRSSERREVILIKYENILRGVDYHLMEILTKPAIRAMVGDRIDYTQITLDNEALLGKERKNILQSIASSTKYYDELDALRQTIIDRYIDFYFQCPALPLVDDLRHMLEDRRVVERIYIYHPHRDERVRVDCEMLFEEFQSRFQYVYGDLEDFLTKHTDITSFITDDIADIGRCISVGNTRFMEFLVAAFRSNFFDDGTPHIDFEEIMQKFICKIGLLIPYSIKEPEDL